jgi:outer membrane protein OmpA-like peptidoglycan-associated protein
VDFKLEITPETIITLKNVFFESAKSALKPESFVELDKLYKFMSLKKTVVIEISGHTDNVGNKDSNQKLSEDRANSVKNYLVKKGIAAARIEIKGYGDSLPVADNSSEEGRKLNRRTVVKILKQ